MTITVGCVADILGSTLSASALGTSGARLVKNTMDLDSDNDVDDYNDYDDIALSVDDHKKDSEVDNAPLMRV
jgi:hypothetical protein